MYRYVYLSAQSTELGNKLFLYNSHVLMVLEPNPIANQFILFILLNRPNSVLSYFNNFIFLLIENAGIPEEFRRLCIKISKC